MITVHFIDAKGRRVTVEAKPGDSVLDVAHANDIDIEGACEGCMACSTCHVIVPDPWFDRLPEPKEEEEDMLDLAFDLQETSRLGCQILLTEELDGIEFHLPRATRNLLIG
ncbi:ferredoxin family 2Fe-2S iron-sulfur cluster binding protein [Minwuia thermotolerans]|uniref:2Fe-2S ferredoxin n=1 Tax=Minwuia thermotolerans TaxID=2056226 RepID=A0A2M9G182_9PROT|nr:ferredoxin family 2Fe-2S iron-sulfur cluster binding protein [Minwuia thermotolerans]PJK29463.1 2Fe-2S ferredoxin [Minwuia thermotolerans]